MSLSPATIQERLHEFRRVCAEAGARITPQRLAIFTEIATSEDHPDADALHRAVRRDMPSISLDTVYRTLWWLSELGLVNTLDPTQEGTRFDANLQRHHHFVCSRCGLTRDFYSDELNSIQLPEEVQAIGITDRTQVEVKGLCHACAASGQRDTTMTTPRTNHPEGDQHE